ncbi:Fra1 [Kluyveromyces lactis]|nr:Fra1 [Kluyveromyces lactis]
MSTVNMRPSLASISGVGPSGPTTATATSSRSFKPCANCTCSYGQLSRQGRRSSALLKQINFSRRHSHFGNPPLSPTSESIYSTDSICQLKSTETAKRLLALRKQMATHDLCCYIIPSEDEHQSEYVSQADERRAFISGFTGSAGVACVTRDVLNFNTDKPEGEAILSTDGRYFNQASQELDCNWTLVRQGEDPITWQQWAVNEAHEMSLALGGKPTKIGIDPRLISFDQVRMFEKVIKDKTEGTNARIEFVAVADNLVDKIWCEFETMPVRDLNELLLLDRKYTGECYKSKRERVMNKISKDHNGASHLVVFALDEICWLLNLRGSDIEYNPVFFAYLVLSNDETILFTDNPFDDKIESYLSENNVKVESYQNIWSFLSDKASALAEKKETILIPSNSSWEIVRKLYGSTMKRVSSPIEVMKSVKNETEIQNAHAAQVKDAVALIQYFSWLEDQLVKHEKLIDEHKASQKLTEIRKTAKHYMGNSFCTISSTGSNAAVIHYEPPEENSSMIDPNKIYLCDSGAQFLEGTTDITRTLHFTDPTQEEIDNYTLVLKGNLALERLVVPEGTSGYNIDVIARQFLWQAGLDYKHGTGHGVGSFLNVHEGPIGIGYKPHLVNFPLEKGNIITNEPGYYKDGEYGIRIENDLLVKEAEGLQFGKRKFLKFENLTMVPYCKKLINTSVLTPEEKSQINDYHTRIWSSIVPFLQPSSIAFKWLKRETKPL